MGRTKKDSAKAPSTYPSPTPSPPSSAEKIFSEPVRLAESSPREDNDDVVQRENRGNRVVRKGLPRVFMRVPDDTVTYT